MKYFVKSLFNGWQEVTAEQFARFCEHIRQGATAIPANKKSEYITTRTRIVREGARV